MASYPNEIKAFTRKVNNQDKVIAPDVNLAYDEIEEVQRQLGVGGVNTSVWGAAQFSTATTNWYSNGGLKARLANIENGVYFVNQTIDGGTP
jgi:hypothetical protein